MRNLPIAKQNGFSTMQIQAPTIAGSYQIIPALRRPIEIAMPPAKHPIVHPTIDDTFMTLVHCLVWFESQSNFAANT